MSSLLVAPEVLETAAASAERIGSALRQAHLTAVVPTTAIPAAAADEVSAAITALFGAHARDYQAAAAKAAAQYEQFVRSLGAAAESYAGAEAAIATSLQGALGHGIGQAWTDSPFGRALDQFIGIGFGVETGTGGQAAAGGGGAAKSIVISFVRHGESEGNLLGYMSSAVPGPALTSLGLTQAQAIGDTLFARGPIAGVFSSQLLRTQMTAAPLATLLGGVDVPSLAGLNEVSVGSYEGLSSDSIQKYIWRVAPIAWWAGLPIVPVLAPGADLNGVGFYRGFTSALETMYSTTVNTSPGPITDVAFSHQFTIEMGTQMTVRNPDPLLMLTHELPNTGEVVMQGNPQDGWTLVSWDGVSVQPHSLPLLLLGTTRDLIFAPQFALNDILESFGTGDPRAITSAIGTGVGDVVTATLNYPIGVVEDVVEALSALPPL
jgi:broad specificity phosphatase PhoE